MSVFMSRNCKTTPCTDHGSKLCPKHVASLGWDNEKIIGVDADHEQIITYPHRGDEQYFDVFMNTLEDLVDNVCPASTQPAFVSSEEPSDLSEPWQVFQNLSASASRLSILAGHYTIPIQ